MFSVGELWATNEPGRGRSGMVKATTQRSKCCIAIVLTSIMFRCSASNPAIEKLPDRAVRLFSEKSMSLVRFLFWTISHVFM